MKIKSLAAATLSVCALSAMTAKVYAYGVDIKTATDLTGSTQATHLFSSVGNAASTNTMIWFVADKNGNGVPTSPVNGASVLGADDVLIFQDVVDGAFFGNNAGRYQRLSTVIPDGQNFESAHIYVYLWNKVIQPTDGTFAIAPTGGGGANLNYTINNGDKFGAVDLGIITIPQVGNASWFITQDIVASTFTVGVPEPSTYALMGIGLVGLIARRFKK